MAQLDDETASKLLNELQILMDAGKIAFEPKFPVDDMDWDDSVLDNTIYEDASTVRATYRYTKEVFLRRVHEADAEYFRLKE